MTTSHEAAVEGRLTRAERRVLEQRKKQVERIMRAPVGPTCEHCLGTCCDYCHWTGLELYPEAS